MPSRADGSWIELTVRAPVPYEEVLSNALLELYPSGTWIEASRGSVVLRCYRPADDAGTGRVRDRAVALVRSRLLEFEREGLLAGGSVSAHELPGVSSVCAPELPGGISVSARELPAEDWVEAVRRQFRPVTIGRVRVLPSWSKTKVGHGGDAAAGATGAGAITIWLDPGLAFGTGLHPTTRRCLLLLQELVEGGEAVLDVGTGSGILAIAAAKLGARSVLALDIDPLACEVARCNAAANRVSIDVVEGSVEALAGKAPALDRFDVAVANLTARDIPEILPALSTRLGTLIASGISAPAAPIVGRALTAHGFELVETYDEESWVTILGSRRDGLGSRRDGGRP